MKKHIMSSMILTLVVFSGSLLAAPVLDENRTLSNDKISNQAWQAIRDIQMSRFALFNGQTQQAKNLAAQAEQDLNDSRTDWSQYVRPDKKAPVEGDKYIRINSSITIAEDYQSTEQKNIAIAKANQKIKEGDKKGAIDALKLAGVSVIENQELLPLKQTRKDVSAALALMKEGKFYQSGLLLKSAEDGVIIDSQSVTNIPEKQVQNNTSETK